MMNREEFIEKLKQSIGILDDQEQQYFVEEYTQHIEMKMSQGMTEEEAVNAMGSIEELSKAILESYHVKPDLNLQDDKGNKINEGIHLFFGKVKIQADKLYGKITSGFGKMANGIKRLLNRKKGNIHTSQKTVVKKRSSSMKDRSIISFIGMLVRKCFYAMLWLLLLMWNFVLIGLGLMGIFVLAFAVFFIGVLIVMVIQGYPLVGITIATMGGTMSVGALTVACFILTRWKLNKKEAVKLEGGEVHA